MGKSTSSRVSRASGRHAPSLFALPCESRPQNGLMRLFYIFHAAKTSLCKAKGILSSAGGSSGNPPSSGQICLFTCKSSPLGQALPKPLCARHRGFCSSAGGSSGNSPSSGHICVLIYKNYSFGISAAAHASPPWNTLPPIRRKACFENQSGNHSENHSGNHSGNHLPSNPAAHCPQLGICVHRLH